MAEFTYDRKITLALVVVLILQATGIIWWAATLTQRISITEGELAIRRPLVEQFINSQGTSIAWQSAVNARLDRIEDKLDGLLERQRN